MLHVAEFMLFLWMTKLVQILYTLVKNAWYHRYTAHSDDNVSLFWEHHDTQ